MSSVDSALGGVLAARESAIMNQIAFAVQAKALDAAKEQGQAAVQLVEQAAQVSKAVDSGSGFDAVG
jgi:hypothetical protein